MRDITKIIKDVIGHIKENKKWWLIPVMVILFILGFLIATAGTAPVPVFVYPVV